MTFQNRPHLNDENGEGKIRRFVHSPLTIEHHGIQVSIKENGKVVLTKVANVKGDEVEFDEIEVPASLIFKVGSLLRATRTIKYVTIQEAKSIPASEE